MAPNSQVFRDKVVEGEDREQVRCRYTKGETIEKDRIHRECENTHDLEDLGHTVGDGRSTSDQRGIEADLYGTFVHSVLRTFFIHSHTLRLFASLALFGSRADPHHLSNRTRFEGIATPCTFTR